VRALIDSTKAELAGEKAFLEKYAEVGAGDEELAKQLDAAEKNIKRLEGRLEDLGFILDDVTQSENERRGAVGHLTDETRELVGEEGEILEARKKEIEFLERVGEAVNAFVEETEALDAARTLSAKREGQDFSIKRLRDQTDFARKQAESDATHFRDRGKKIAAFNREIANDENEVLKARAKEVESANLEQIRAAEDYARAVKGIQNDIGDAAANLDAIGVRNAKRRLTEAQEQFGVESRRRKEDTNRKIDDLVESAEDERKLRLEAFKQELADDEEQYATERQRDQDNFRQQLQREDEDRALRLQRQVEDNARQDAERKKAFDRTIENLRKQLLEPEEKMKSDSSARQRKDLKSALDSVEGDIRGFKARVTSSTADLANSVATVSAASTRSVSVASSTNRSASQDSFARRFGNGGTFGAGDFGVVGDRRGPELIQFGAAGRVFSPDQTRGMLGGKSFQHYGDVYLGRDLAPAEMREQVREYMADEFELLSAGGQ
jgi:chromosome segregation ATPase